MSNMIRKERTYLHMPSANIVMAFYLKGNVDTDALANAIRAVSAGHEILSCRIKLNEDGSASYQHQEFSASQVEVKEGICWEDVLHEMERIPFHIGQGEWMHHVLIKLKDGLEWVIVAHHLAGDGYSLLYFARDVLTAMQIPGQNMPFHPLRLFEPGDMPAGAKLNPLLGLMMHLTNRRWEKKRKTFSWEDRIRLHEKFWSARRTGIISREMEGEKLSHLLEVCRDHHVTLTAAMVTALLLCTPGESDVGLAVSVRPEGFEGMGNYATGVSIQFKPDTQKEFWSNAAKVHKSMLDKINHPGKKFFLLNFMNAITPTLIDAAYYSAVDGFADPSAASMSRMFGYQGNGKGISLTNLTRAPIPGQYGDISLHRIVFVPPLVPNAKRILGIVTTGSNMNVTMQYCVDYKENQLIFEKTFELLSSV